MEMSGGFHGEASETQGVIFNFQCGGGCGVAKLADVGGWEK